MNTLEMYSFEYYNKNCDKIVLILNGLKSYTRKGGTGFMWTIKKGYDSVSKSFRLPEEIVKKIDYLAYKNNISSNQIVIQCLNYAINNLDDTENDEK